MCYDAETSDAGSRGIRSAESVIALSAMGFQSSEVFHALTWADGRLGVPGTVHGKEAIFLVDTSLRLDVSLHGPYVHMRGFPVLRTNDWFSVCSLTDCVILGRRRQENTAVFAGQPEADYTSSYAGRVGVRFYKDGILGLDAAGPTTAFSSREGALSRLPDSALSIPLLPDVTDAMPITAALRDDSADGFRPTILFDTEATTSSLYLPYVQRHWPAGRPQRNARRAFRKGGTVLMTLTVPGGRTVDLAVRLESEARTYAVDLGVPEIHGVLGIDFLRRWIQVFDFPGRALYLVDY